MSAPGDQVPPRRSLLVLALVLLDAVLAILGCVSPTMRLLRAPLARWRRSLLPREPAGIPRLDLRAVTPRLSEWWP